MPNGTRLTTTRARARSRRQHRDRLKDGQLRPEHPRRRRGDPKSRSTGRCGSTARAELLVHDLGLDDRRRRGRPPSTTASARSARATSRRSVSRPPRHRRRVVRVRLHHRTTRGSTDRTRTRAARRTSPACAWVRHGSVTRHNTIAVRRARTSRRTPAARPTSRATATSRRSRTTRRSNNLFWTTGGTCAYGGSVARATVPRRRQQRVPGERLPARSRQPWRRGGKCGYWFAMTYLAAGLRGNQWVGNVWDSGGAVPTS